MELSIRDGLFWGADLRLKSWAGYQSRFGPYGSKDKEEPSDGTVRLIFAPEGRDLEPLTDREARLIAWFERNEPDVSNAAKAAIISWCSPHSERKTRFDFDDGFPVIEDEADLRNNIGPFAVYIHQLDVMGIPYVGFEFGCEWDEHGLGVLMHGTRAVDIGLADTASLLWIAERDAQSTGAK
jgi:hypothetical protein